MCMCEREKRRKRGREMGEIEGAVLIKPRYDASGGAFGMVHECAGGAKAFAPEVGPRG